MAKKKNGESASSKKANNPNVLGLRPEVLHQPITQTLEINYMPYAMSVIISRAIPEIDGFKPSHRKLLYTMYQMKLLGGSRTKSANIVGSTMKLNPHGDAAIYDTMVRLSRGYGALLHPLVDSKGNFGKVFSRDMAWAASRYTEARLDAICNELFRDIDQDTVDFVDNYDGKLKEPALLPTTYPNILVSSNQGIAVGMASNICGFNLTEVCTTAIARIKDPMHPILSTLKGPDLPTGGELVYNEQELDQIYRTGRGSFKVRAKWRFIPEENLIEVFEIPYSTTVEAIIDKIAELIKLGKIKDISDVRDETDLSGLKITIDLKRGVDPEKLMARLFRYTPLMDSQSCNFNILIAGMPRVMGVGEILEEWTAWRSESVKRRTHFAMARKQEKLHLLKGLRRILLDIDKAISIIRETEEEAEVIPNLMIGFGIDKVQAEYVADIRLRNINKEYILRRTAELEDLEREIADLKDILANPARIESIIISELESVISKYGVPRRTTIAFDAVQELEELAGEEIADYPVHCFLSKEGYFKKITPQSLRMAATQKYKEGDEPFLQWDCSNRDEILIFTDRQQCYKCYLSDLDDTKASVLGDYLPTKLSLDEGERILWACQPEDFKGSILFLFENGKAARVALSTYETQTRRKKLTGAYSDKSPLVTAYHLKEDLELAMLSSEGRCIIFHTATLNVKTTRATQGVAVMTIKKSGHKVESVTPVSHLAIANTARYRMRSLPAVGAILKEEDRGEEQITLL